MKIWISLSFGLAMAALAQDAAPQPVTLSFRDATAPRKLVVENLIGSVTVKGYAGKDAVIESSGHDGLLGLGLGDRASAPAGMRRLGPARSDLSASEQNNVITVRGGLFGKTDLTIQVPVETSVTVNSLAGGAIVIENISGEVEASNMAGPVTVANVSGSVVAHSMTDKITVSLNKVTPDKSMSFSTMHGDIEVTLPAATKANLKTKSYSGDVFTDSDFDIKVDSAAGASNVKEKGGDGKTRVRRKYSSSSTLNGTINGGGPVFQFSTYNGRILIHKK